MTTAATTAVAAGRNRITSRALHRVVRAVTADALGVDASRVAVELADAQGLLALTVTTPIRVVSLDRVHRDRAAAAPGAVPGAVTAAVPGVVERSGGSIVARAARAQETIRDRVTLLTGSAVGRVTVRLSAADIQKEERVR